jgi:hypothetical protein
VSAQIHHIIEGEREGEEREGEEREGETKRESE